MPNCVRDGTVQTAIGSFENQRRIADKSDTRTAQYLYVMMQKIAKRLYRSASALTVSGSGATPGRMLDFVHGARRLSQRGSKIQFGLVRSYVQPTSI